MTFVAINYQLLLEDFIYSIAAGFFAGFLNQVLGIFLYRGRVRLFIKDMVMFFIFSIVIFSFVISFANYPILRYYHILGGGIGFLIFLPKFSRPFNFISKRVLIFAKKQTKGRLKQINNTYCNIKKKYNTKKDVKIKNPEQNLLQMEDIMVYNL